MSVVQQGVIRTPFQLSHSQIACNSTYVVLPYVRTTLGVWKLDQITAKPLSLEGHHGRVSASCFGHQALPTLLCSASDDYVIIWNIENVFKCLLTGKQITGSVIGTSLGHINYCSFNLDDSLVAICSDRTVHILHTHEERVQSILEGHDSMVSCCEFCPHYTATLVTVSHDRTFKVWNVEDGCIVYQSTIISSSPFISLAMSKAHEQVAMGTADGQVRIYDMSDGNDFRCLHELDVPKILSKYKETALDQRENDSTNKEPNFVSSRPSWQKQKMSHDQKDDPTEGATDLSEVGCSIIGLFYTYQPLTEHREDNENQFLQQSDTVVKDLLASQPTLVIGTTGGILQVNVKTLELIQFTDFQDQTSVAPGLGSLSTAGCYAFCQPNPSQVWCVVGSLFEPLVYVLTETIKSTIGNLPDILDGSLSLNESSPILSVLSSAPLFPNSPLKAELTPKVKDATTTQKGTKKMVMAVATKGQVVDQPLTFKSKVRSSGYSAESPRRTMFQPKTNSSKSAPPTKTPSRLSNRKSAIKEYAMNCGSPSQLKEKLDIAEKPAAINKIQFSGDGQYLACALANNSAQLVKMPLSSGKGTSLVGHNGAVNAITWSHDNQLLLSCSDDKTSMLWSKSGNEPIMEFKTVNNNFSVDKEGSTAKLDKENPMFGQEIKLIQFYYVDKFILLVSGNAFNMYKYHLDPTKSDLKRYKTNSRYKIVKSFQMTEAQQITALSAINSFHSYLVLCAGSNKTVEIFDMNAAKSVHCFQDVHSAKPAHVICQNQGSSYASHPATAYDMFLTAAANDSIKLWDLRTKSCVRRYEGHSNRAHSCGLDISPCSKFIASGSEDRAAYVFDVRSGTYLHKLTGHTDVVSDVVFHPMYSQLATACLNGKIRLYTEP